VIAARLRSQYAQCG